MNISFPSAHTNISNADYHGTCPGVSSSQLKTLIQQTPAHYKAKYIDGGDPQPPTDAMNFGTLVHTLVLEPDQFESEFIIAPKVDRRTKAGKADWAAFQDEARGKLIVSEQDKLTASKVAEAIRAMPIMQAAFQRDHQIEHSLFWEDPDTGLACKCRPDFASLPAIIDLKTTGDASPDEFARSIFKFGYHLSAAHYIEGCNQVWGKGEVVAQHFILVCAEKAAPYAVVPYSIAEQDLEIARRQRAKALQTLAQCLETDTWPAYPQTITPLAMPAWARKRAA